MASEGKKIANLLVKKRVAIFCLGELRLGTLAVLTRRAAVAFFKQTMKVIDIGKARLIGCLLDGHRLVGDVVKRQLQARTDKFFVRRGVKVLPVQAIELALTDLQQVAELFCRPLLLTIC